MGRILSIDFGKKRTGLAVTDPLRMIATALETVDSSQLISFLTKYFERETVDILVLGMPKNLKNQDTEMTEPARQLAETLRKTFPEKPLHFMDERFTSSLAKRVLIDSGAKKKDRQVKGNTDKISATIILQDFLTMQR